MTGFEIAGAVFSGIQGLELCIRLCRHIISNYQDYANASSTLKSLLQQIDATKATISNAVAGIHRDEDSRGFPKALREMLEELLLISETRLDAARAAAEGAASVKRFITFLARDPLHSIVGELEKWLTLLRSAHSLLALRPSMDTSDEKQPDEKAALAIKKLRDAASPGTGGNGSIFRDDVPLSFRSCIRHSSTEEATLSTVPTRKVIIDTVLATPSPLALRQHEIANRAADIGELGRVLSKVDPMLFGVLSCQGIIPHMPEKFEFVFDIPDGLSNPRSLRSILLDGSASKKYPLEDRINLARSIAKSVLFVHSFKYVHKNIRPDTILVFESASSSSSLGIPFLVGWENVRSIGEHTRLQNDDIWWRDLYRHPSRQGLTLRPEDEYKMQHDIYSLGICLLEIGLWLSFVDEDCSLPHETLAIKEYLAQRERNENPRKQAKLVKERLVQVAHELLPERVGTTYANIVVSCLSCLDPRNSGFGDQYDGELSDDDGILVGVRYIEKILSAFEELRL